MKLIYLWLGNYKNIKEKGFKLNPTVIEDSVYKKNNLIYIKLKERDDYINPFGSQFNIITIAGKNGSGKSNIISALSSIIRYISNYGKKYDISDNYDPISLPDEYCLITKEDDVYIAYCSSAISFDIEINKEKTIVKCDVKILQDNKFIKSQLFKNRKIKVAKFQPFFKHRRYSFF
jgi:AAA15 family ATPase/GTPase